MFGGRIRGELCTPTGTALLKYFADRFGPVAMSKAKAIGFCISRFRFCHLQLFLLPSKIQRSCLLCY
ncbi:MAG: DUF111 family protein [Bacillota bacterium]|nr:DUF111 family protein [Bacillota bacterium]